MIRRHEPESRDSKNRKDRMALPVSYKYGQPVFYQPRIFLKS